MPEHEKIVFAQLLQFCTILDNSTNRPNRHFCIPQIQTPPSVSVIEDQGYQFDSLPSIYLHTYKKISHVIDNTTYKDFFVQYGKYFSMARYLGINPYIIGPRIGCAFVQGIVLIQIFQCFCFQ